MAQPEYFLFMYFDSQSILITSKPLVYVEATLLCRHYESCYGQYHNLMPVTPALRAIQRDAWLKIGEQLPVRVKISPHRKPAVITRLAKPSLWQRFLDWLMGIESESEAITFVTPHSLRPTTPFACKECN